MANKKKIAYIVGTRPEIIRSAEIIIALKNDPQVELQFIHTGQHYDDTMSESFFKELHIPMPNKRLQVGSGTHGEQTAKMMVELEKTFVEHQPDIVTVFGDTNSALAGALAATKLHIPIAHLEAGCREWDMSVPEEVNRRLIDHCANILLAVSKTSIKNLRDEKVLGAMENVGDPLYNVFHVELKASRKLDLVKKLGLTTGTYILLTAHRAGNVDNCARLKEILKSLNDVKKYRIVFPIHPRTKNQLEKCALTQQELNNFLIIDPVGHQEMLHLVDNARMVVTDSGGLQKEVFWAGIPCITLRDITAWSETVDAGVNFLTGETGKKGIIDAINDVEKNYEKIKKIFAKIKNPYYQSDTIKKTVTLIKKFCNVTW